MTRKLTTLIFFPNGNVAGCDQNGQQWSRYQFGKHGDIMKVMAIDGISLSHVPEVLGHSDGEREYTDEQLVEKLKEERLQ